MNSSIPPRETCVLRYVLDQWAAEKPDQVFLVFEDDESWTYAEMRERTRELGAALQATGVGEGDHVVVWLPNGKECLTAYFALGYIGAVFVPVNVAYRGDLLAHVIDNAGAALAIVHPDLAPRLEEIDTAALKTIVTTGPETVPVTGLNTLSYNAFLAKPGLMRALRREIEPWDTQAIIYTSGTTGPSKGVLSSYLHNYAGMNGEVWTCVGNEDRYLINMPMFHIGGCFILYFMLCRGASIAMTTGFRTDTFWDTVQRTRSTVVFLLGVMASFLLKAPPREDDEDHPMKTMMVVPFNVEATKLSDRFGVTVHTIFNMKELSCPIFSPPNQATAGKRGTVWRCGSSTRRTSKFRRATPAN